MIGSLVQTSRPGRLASNKDSAVAGREVCGLECGLEVRPTLSVCVAYLSVGVWPAKGVDPRWMWPTHSTTLYYRGCGDVAYPLYYPLLEWPPLY